MKHGIVLEGGAMRGLFTCGILDVLMENNIYVDGAVGTSAGAVFGCNYKSKQIGRPYRYNTTYCNDSRYASIKSWLLTGDLYNKEFAYYRVPFELDPFDIAAYQSTPMDFYVTCSDVHTGEAVYHQCITGDKDEIEWFRASASMPIVSKIVHVDGYDLLDGGVGDSIPVKFLESKGFTRNIVVLTQPADFVKQPNKLLPIIKIIYRKYPKFIEAVANRHERYNETLAYIRQKEASGQMFVIRPDDALEIGSREKNPDELTRVYQLGREVALKNLDKIKEFLSI